MVVYPSNFNNPNINIRSLRVRNSGLSLGQLEAILGYKRSCRKEKKTNKNKNKKTTLTKTPEMEKPQSKPTEQKRVSFYAWCHWTGAKGEFWGNEGMTEKLYNLRLAQAWLMCPLVSVWDGDPWEVMPCSETSWFLRTQMMLLTVVQRLLPVKPGLLCGICSAPWRAPVSGQALKERSASSKVNCYP